MPRIVLIHWNAEEAESRVDHLRDLSHSAELYSKYDSQALRRWRDDPPDAFLIDLSRLPSHGREMAVHLRSSKATRNIPLLFVEGAPEKVAAVQQVLPDAVYCRWTEADSALSLTLATRTSDPVQPVAMMQRYSGRTAAEKLGITAGSRVRLIDAPRQGDRLLEPLPPDAQLSEDSTSQESVTLWFVETAAALLEGLPLHAPCAVYSKLWILWRKQKTRRVRGDVSEQVLRDAALPLGLVDYKVCSVDDTWSALCFSYRKGSAATR